MAEQLGELRALTRGTAGWISRAPSVRETFWAGKPANTSGVPVYSGIEQGRNLLKCELALGCFWQDKPEDCVALCRDLMSSGQFPSLASLLVFRGPANPRLIAWRAADEKRVNGIWQKFLAELDSATNRFWRLDADCCRVADGQLSAGAFFGGVFADRASFLTNDVARLAFRSELDPFFAGIGGEIGAEYQRRTRALDDEIAFLKQRQYLASQTPYEPVSFSCMFEEFRFYSKAQALELEPLLAPYKSNLVARLSGMTNRDQRQYAYAMREVELLEDRLFQAAHPEAWVWRTRVLTNGEPGPVLRETNVAPRSATRAAPTSAGSPEPAPSIRLRARFLKMPRERLPRQAGFPNPQTPIEVLDHRVCGGKLWLDVHYQDRQANGAGETHHRVTATVLDLEAASWEMVECVREDDPLGAGGLAWHYRPDRSFNVGAFGNALFVSEWPEQIAKYDLTARCWERLEIPIEKASRLFTVGARFYAATDECIVELTDGGHSTRILASCRRRPVASALDALDGYGDLTLFPGPENSVRAAIGDRVFSWDGQDWSVVTSLLAFRSQETFEEATLFRSGDGLDRAQFRMRAELWMLPHAASTVQLCLREESDTARRSGSIVPRPNPKTLSQPAPIWDSLPDVSLVNSPAAAAGSNLYFLVAECEVTSRDGLEFPVAGALPRTDLVCLDRRFPKPLVIPLRFGPDPQPSLSAANWDRSGLVQTRVAAPRRTPGPDLRRPPWMVFAGDCLILGRALLPGVWAIPRSEIDAAVAAEKQRQEDLMLRTKP